LAQLKSIIAVNKKSNPNNKSRSAGLQSSVSNIGRLLHLGVDFMQLTGRGFNASFLLFRNFLWFNLPGLL
jgi:hypothetical protein